MSHQAEGVTAGDLMDPPPAPVHPDDELRSAVRAPLDASLIAQPIFDGASYLVGLLDEADLFVPDEDRHVVAQEAEVARFEVMADHHAAALPTADGEGRVVGVRTRHALLEAWWAGRRC